MLVKDVISSASLHAIIMRFIVVGMASGLLFASVTSVAIDRFHASPAFAGAIGYCVSVPLNFLAHRHFTFRSKNAWMWQAFRFLLLHLVNIGITIFAMQAAVHYLHLSYGWGIFGAVVLVPAFNFAASHMWVFKKSGEAE